MHPHETAIMVGGPADGMVRVIPEIMNQLRMPVPPPISYRSGVATGTAIVQAAVYELVRRFDLQPSRDDLGQLRYRYVGTHDL